MSDLTPSPWQVLLHVRQCLGDGAALRLISEAGGQQVTVPRRALGSALARRLGLEIATCLAERWGGQTLELPSKGAYDSRARAAERRRAVVEAGTAQSGSALARQLGCTRRWIQELRREAREGRDPRQGQLFEDVD